VVSSNFLIDSESRMRLTNVSGAQKVEKQATVRDLVCGMDVDLKSSNTFKTLHAGETYYFCSKLCKESFEANPGKYVHDAMAAQDVHGIQVSQ